MHPSRSKQGSLSPEKRTPSKRGSIGYFSLTRNIRLNLLERKSPSLGQNTSSDMLGEESTPIFEVMDPTENANFKKSGAEIRQ